MNNFREPSRPFDPTAKALQNLVINEHRLLATLDKYIFIPSHGPYYVESLVVRRGGTVLVKDVDYKALVLHPAATHETGKEVAVCIKVINRAYTDVSITYQAVGGKYQSLVEILRLIKENAGDKLLTPIIYHEIVDKPTSFNPAAHWHVMWDFGGWEVLINNLDKIRNGVLWRKNTDIRNVYDYYYAKRATFNTWFENRIAAYKQQFDLVKSKAIMPNGFIVGSVNYQTFEDGVYQMLTNTFLYGVEVDNDLGRTWGLSEEIVYPYPDNILLNESSVPFTRDTGNDGDWIFLDNQYAAENRIIDYWEPVDEQFDARTIKYYWKESNAPAYNAVAASNKTTLNEDEIVLFTITTTSYPAGVEIPYQLTGVGISNVNVPLVGTVITNSSGVGTLAVKLMPGSPRTDLSRMEIEFFILGGKTAFVNYNLLSNVVQSTKSYFTRSLNGPKEEVLVQGDQYYLRIEHRGLAGKTIHLRTGLSAANTVVVGGVNYAGNAVIPIVVPNTTATLLNIKIKVLFVNGFVQQAGGFNLTRQDASIENIVGDVAPYRYLDFFAYDNQTGARLTSINYGRQFRLELQHNSKDALIVPASIPNIVVSGSLDPTTLNNIYLSPTGSGETGIMVVTPNDNPATGTITFRVTDPYGKGYTRDVVLSITPPTVGG